MKKTTLLLLPVILMSTFAYSAIKLPALVRDSMILQRDAMIRIWGWADPGEKVSVTFRNKKYKTSTAKDGRWMIILLSTGPGGPFNMHISGTNIIDIKNILVGDVWFCSGQSNMVHQMELHKETYEKDIATAAYPQIRHFFIPPLTNLQGAKDDLPAGYWKAAIPADLPRFSAVAYFFAKTLYDKYKIPIGLINASVGGTPIEAWTSETGLKSFSSIYSTIEKNKDTAYVNGINRKAFANSQARARKPRDLGMVPGKCWYDISYTPKGWHNINIPGYWEDQGVKDLDGIVWYRKEINVPASMTGVPAKIALGRIVDADYLYVNGVLAGNTAYQYPQRRYQLPPGLLKEGKNILVVRVINSSGKGGFVPGKPYYLSAAGQRLDLKGDWQYKVGEVYEQDSHAGTIAPLSAQNQPAALFNAMVAPVTNYAIKGILWYQGESNVGNASAYQNLLAALISDWRAQWQQPALPFLYVQLPNFQEVQYLPSESNWAVIREAQRATLSVPNTGMAVAIDLGEWNDIHPDNKKDVGVRLALSALKVAYHEDDVVYSGPLFQSAVLQDNKIVVTFSNTGSGLVTKDGEDPSWFAIAGSDGKFKWAKAKIDGNTVVLSSEEVPKPMFVRYAWADNPDGANLYNKEDLPASPFRTDK